MSSVFINIVFITFTPRVVDFVKSPWSNFCFNFRHFNIDCFALYYVVLSSVVPYVILCSLYVQKSLNFVKAFQDTQAKKERSCHWIWPIYFHERWKQTDVNYMQLEDTFISDI